MNFIESIVIDCKDNDFILKSYAFLELSLWLNTILVLEDCCQLVYFLYCKIYQFFSKSFNICHCI